MKVGSIPHMGCDAGGRLRTDRCRWFHLGSLQVDFLVFLYSSQGNSYQTTSTPYSHHRWWWRRTQRKDCLNWWRLQHVQFRCSCSWWKWRSLNHHQTSTEMNHVLTGLNATMIANKVRLARTLLSLAMTWPNSIPPCSKLATACMENRMTRCHHINHIKKTVVRWWGSAGAASTAN
jgi:hypothetical protein